MKTAVSIPDEVFEGAEQTSCSHTSCSNKVTCCGRICTILTLDRELLTERAGKIPRARLELLFMGIDIVLGR